MKKSGGRVSSPAVRKGALAYARATDTLLSTQIKLPTYQVLAVASG